jgi:hypothetical protein
LNGRKKIFKGCKISPIEIAGAAFPAKSEGLTPLSAPCAARDDGVPFAQSLSRIQVIYLNQHLFTF